MIPLVAPSTTFRDRAYLAQVFSRGGLEDEIEVRRFEEAFAEFVGASWCVATCSGSAALTVALRALGLCDQEVMTGTYGCVAVLHAIHGCESYPELMDVSFDIKSAWPALTSYVPVHVLVHLFGQPTTGRAEIEDYTLSLGGVHNVFCRLGVCSTHQSKMISTGRGGVVFGRDPQLHERVRRMVSYDDYEYDHDGFNGGVQYSLRMSSLQAALGVSQLRQLPAFIEERRTLAARYTEAFRSVGIECPDADCGSVFYRYLVGVDDPAGKIEALKTRNVQCGRGVFPALHQYLGLEDDRFPHATRSLSRLLSVPVHPSISEFEANHIIEQVKRVCAP